MGEGLETEERLRELQGARKAHATATCSGAPQRRRRSSGSSGPVGRRRPETGRCPLRSQPINRRSSPASQHIQFEYAKSGREKSGKELQEESIAMRKRWYARVFTHNLERGMRHLPEFRFEKR